MVGSSVSNTVGVLLRDVLGVEVVGLRDGI